MFPLNFIYSLWMKLRHFASFWDLYYSVFVKKLLATSYISYKGSSLHLHAICSTGFFCFLFFLVFFVCSECAVVGWDCYK